MPTETLFIEIGNGSCGAGCGHCPHSRQSVPDRWTFSEAQLDMYKRIRAYGSVANIPVNTSLLNDINQEINYSFIDGSLSLSVCVTLGEIIESKTLLERLELKFGGLNTPFSEIRFQVEFGPDILALSTERMFKLLWFQSLIAEKYKVRAVIVAFNANTYSEKVEDIYIDITTVALKYRSVVISTFERLVTSSMVSVVTEPSVLRMWAHVEVPTLGCQLILGGRLLEKDHSPDQAKIMEDRSRHDNTCMVSLLPKHVQFNHMTYNINDPSLRFSYDDFGRILTGVQKRQGDLLRTLFRHVDARRKRKQKMITVTSA